jgi:mRNA interferase MazF
MKQGDIWLANLNPTQGTEQFGTRPFVIISGNLMNDVSDLVIGCSLTSTIRNLRSNTILPITESNGLSVKSEVLVHHIRSITKSRFKQKIGQISQSQLKEIKENLNKLLTY